LVIAGWLWGLLIWSFNGLNLFGAEAFLEVVLVWVTLFILIDWINHFKLGKMQWNGGTALAKLKGITAVITDSELTEMQSNSKQILAAMRWLLDLLTLTWLCVILIQGVDIWLRPTLWLASVYVLTFTSETWLRLRGRLPK